MAGTTERVSVASDGTEGNGELGDEFPSISGDGRFVAFTSRASNLVPGDSNGSSDIFVYDRDTGTTQRTTIGFDGTEANGNSRRATLSADGKFLVFVSDAWNLVPEDANASFDVFRQDLQTGAIERISIASNGIEAFDVSESPSISADGGVVSFESRAFNLVPGDTNGSGQNIFLYEQ